MNGCRQTTKLGTRLSQQVIHAISRLGITTVSPAEPERVMSVVRGKSSVV
jgi:hypothetical protein